MDLHIPVTTTNRKFYKIYVDCINYMYKLNFTSAQKAILAELMYQNYHHKDIPKEQRDSIILSPTSKQEMIKLLKCNKGTFNNTLTLFRNKIGLYGTILTGISLNEDYLIYPDSDAINTINITITTTTNATKKLPI